MQWNVVLSVFKRNVASYFSSMLGYLFIVVFVVAGAFHAFNDQFFANNLANLDQLSYSFPLLLLFIVPAITMSIWSDERRMGTDEILFTLPATDFSILLGKYLAVLSVYTVVLAFSFTHALILSRLGNPDIGLIMTTYLGYWLSGAALLSAGMFASSLTNSSTVAFVLGAAICSIPVFIDGFPVINRLVRDVLQLNEPLGVAGHLQSFTSGKIAYSSIFYFVGLTAFFLYLNSIVISRRHWVGTPKSRVLATQFAVRAACLFVTLTALTYTLAATGNSVDATSERLHTLSSTTLEVIKKVPQDHPITMQAFISDVVPQSLVSVKKDLINKLTEFDKRGGSRITLRMVNVDPFSPAAEQAEALGIRSQRMMNEEAARVSEIDVYMGVVLSSGFDSVSIPFFDRGTPIEYELTRSIGTISREQRRIVGILDNDVQPFGGMDMQTFRQSPEWQIVTELKKQYDVRKISPNEAINETMDVLIAFMPSSLTEPQMDHFVGYVESGKPVLIFDDPIPVWGPNGGSGISWAPLEPKAAPGMGMMGMQQRSGEPKADGGRATSLLRALGIQWDVSDSLFDMSNPYPAFADRFPPELMFVGTPEGINPADSITAGLQELILFSPGYISRSDSNVDLHVLLNSRAGTCGINEWNKITRAGFMGGRSYNFNVNHRVEENAFNIAARIKGKGDRKVNAIFVADLDLVNDNMFQVWQQQLLDLKIDNVLFVLNCVDSLAGDEQYIALRNRRPRHRTLKLIENQKRIFDEERQKEIVAADTEAEKELEDAKQRLSKIIADLKKDLEKGNVDAGTIQVRLQNAEVAENRKLIQRQSEIEREKDEKVHHTRREYKQHVSRIENGTKLWALFIPPLPAIFLGLAVLISRVVDERRGIASDRLLE